MICHMKKSSLCYFCIRSLFPISLDISDKIFIHTEFSSAGVKKTQGSGVRLNNSL